MKLKECTAPRCCNDHYFRSPLLTKLPSCGQNSAVTFLSPFPPSHFPLLFLLVSLFFLPSLPLLLLSPPHYLSLLSLLTTLLRSGRSGCSWSVLVPPTVPPLPTSWSAPRRCSRLSRNLGCWKGQCPNHQPHSHILISHSQSP